MTQNTILGFLPINKAGDTMTGFLTLNANPTSALHAATKQYVDALAAGFDFKASCYVATTGNLTATYDNGTDGVGATLTNSAAMAAFTSDGQSPGANSRVLVWQQTNAFENGIYTLTTVGDGATNWVLTRSTDYDEIAEITPGTFVIVENGTLYENTAFVQEDTVAIIGTDSITFVEFNPIPSSVANQALSNLVGVAINTSLISDTDDTDDLGSSSIKWANVYATNGFFNNGGLRLEDTNASHHLIVTPGSDLTADRIFTLTTGDAARTLDISAANVAISSFGASLVDDATAGDARTTLGLGTMATQAASAVSITGGTLAGVSATTFTFTTGSIGTAVTGVTQSANDNSTKLATTAYVDAAAAGSGISPIIGDTKNLVIKNNTTNPNYQVDVDADSVILSDGSTEFKATSVNLTIDITASGANGLDTGSEAGSTWYYIYVIYNDGTTATAGLLSTSASSPTIPSGYDHIALVGAIYNNGSSNFYKSWQYQRDCFIELINVLDAGDPAAADTFESLSITAAVPSIARAASGVMGFINNTGSGLNQIALAGDDNGVGYQFQGSYTYGLGELDNFDKGTNFEIPLITSQTLYWKLKNDAAVGVISISGYKI